MTRLQGQPRPRFRLDSVRLRGGVLGAIHALALAESQRVFEPSFGHGARLIHRLLGESERLFGRL
ncbi:MAG: hypothetical protein AB1449_09950 [Chloroflexota bacterium]